MRPLVVSVVTLACAACSDSSGYGNNGGSGNPPPPGGSIVSIAVQDYSFSPSSRSVSVGTTVRWTNNGPSAHTSTSNASAWNSGTLAAPSGGSYGGGSAGGSYQYAFSTAGSYSYHCNFHSQMTGTITVTP